MAITSNVLKPFDESFLEESVLTAVHSAERPVPHKPIAMRDSLKLPKLLRPLTETQIKYSALRKRSEMVKILLAVYSVFDSKNGCMNTVIIGPTVKVTEQEIAGSKFFTEK